MFTAFASHYRRLVAVVLLLTVSGCSREKAVLRPFAWADRDIFREADFKVAQPSPTDFGQELPTLAQVEWSFATAAMTEKTSADEALWGYRDTALMADVALGTAADEPSRQRLAWLHSMALRRCLRLTGADRAESHDDLTARLAKVGLSLRYAEPAWNGLTFTKIQPASDYEDRNIEPIVERPGWGLPVLAVRVYGDEETRPSAEAFFPPNNRLTATATMRPAMHGVAAGPTSWREMPADLVLHTPLEQDIYESVSGGGMTLAADFTTPSLVQFSDRGIRAIEYEGVVLPDLVQEKASIYMNEPYRPGRIPVVFVHGLWSSPRTWTDMNNSLLADPEIRRNYQFFFALYPTGDPVMESARILRAKFREMRDTFDPERADPAWDQAVVVGHSMGGIISRLLVTDSGDTFERAVFTKPLHELNISEPQMALLRERLIFENVPEFRRAVFIAAVFRGSSFASRPVGRLSSALVRMPQDNNALRREILKNNPPEALQPEFRKLTRLNGIDNLEPTNPFILALDKTMPDPSVHYHVILGDNGRLIPRLRGEITDGLVTYSSGKLDGAESELIVSANHHLNHDEPVIAEVGRILREHLGAVSSEFVREPFGEMTESEIALKVPVVRVRR